jgi:hypothetical protein
LPASGRCARVPRVMPKRLVTVVVLSVLMLATLGAMASLLG